MGWGCSGYRSGQLYIYCTQYNIGTRGPQVSCLELADVRSGELIFQIMKYVERELPGFPGFLERGSYL